MHYNSAKLNYKLDPQSSLMNEKSQEILKKKRANDADKKYYSEIKSGMEDYSVLSKERGLFSTMRATGFSKMINSDID